MYHKRLFAKIFTRPSTLLMMLAIMWGIGGEAHAGQPYRYYKFQPTALRDSPAFSNSMQMSELQVYDASGQINPVGATNPGGNNPGAEGPPNVIDNSLATKCLDFNKGSIILDLGTSKIITQYCWGTAGDAPERDPISWNFLGSNDGTNFTLLDSQANYPVTTTRNVYVPSGTTTFPPTAFFSLIAVNSINPTSGVPAGGNSITITGAGFASGATVTFGGIASPFVTVIDSTTINCTVPAGTLGSIVDVKVTNSNGTVDTLSNSYVYSNVAPGTITWNGATNSKWSVGTNWNLGRAPVTGDTIILTGAGFAPSDLDIPNLTIFGLTINNTATVPFTITPSSGATGLTLKSTLNVDGANHVFAGNLVLFSTLTATIASTRSFTVNGVVSGNATNNLSVAGAGTLALANPANTYLGDTAVGSGATLQVAVLANGGTNSSIGVATSALTLNGGTLAFSGSSSSTNRAIAISANSTIDTGTGDLTLAGLVSGSSLTKNGSGTLTFSVPNSYLNTTANAGKIISAVPGGLGRGTVTLNNSATMSIGTGTLLTGISGFGGNGTGYSVNGGATVNSDVVTLTNGGFSEARSIYYNAPIANITTGFVAHFTYNTFGGADGAAFVVQQSPNGALAVGSAGGGVGFSGITPSFALCLNIFASNTIGYAYCTNGNVIPYTSTAPVPLTNGSDVDITVTYNGTTVVTKFVNGANTFTTPPFNLNLTQVLGTTSAFVGFSGGTGGQSSIQTVKNFSLQSITPQYANAIVANNSPTIDIAATAASPTVQIGSLTMGSGSTLNVVTDPSTPANQAVALSFGSGSLSGPATIHVVNNGTAVNTVTVGPVGQSSSSTLTKTGNGSLVFSGASTYSGPTTVGDGALYVGTATPTSTASLTSAVIINGNGGNGGGNTPETGSQFRGTGTGGVIGTGAPVGADAIIWPGAATTINNLAANETLTCASADLSSGGNLNVLLRSIGVAPVASQILATTGTGESIKLSALSILTFNADSTDDVEFVVASSGTHLGISSPFGIVNGSGIYGLEYNIVYRDTLTPSPDIVNPPLGAGYGPLAHSCNQVVIVGRNVRPTATSQSVNVAFQTATSVTLQGVDPNALALTYNPISSPAHGILSGTAPDLIYTPAPGYAGPDSFQFTVTNTLSRTSAAATVTLTVDYGVPVGDAKNVNVAFNTGTAITLTATDPNIPPLSLSSYTVTASPTHGSLSGTAPNVTYTPTAGYNGTDSFQFTATNTAGKTSSPATISLTVSAGTPTANGQSVNVGFNTPQAITLTGSDPDVPPLALTYAVTVGPIHGTLSGTAPNLTYTPATGYSGPDSFQFTVMNTSNNTSTPATVSITIPIGAPSADAQSVNVPFNTATAVTLTGSDPNTAVIETPLTFAVTVIPTHGLLSGTAPNLVYTPTAGYNGADSFQFKTTNQAALSSTAATVSLTVAAGVPTADPQTKNVPFQTATAITLTGSDPDVPALALTYAVTVIPVHGTLSGTEPNLTYTPATGYSGSDSFQFTVKNTANNTSTAATVSITVPVGAPSANAQSVDVSFNTATAVTLTGSDPNTAVIETPLTFAVTVTPTHGTLSGTEPNLIYTPTAGYNGADSFQFTTTNQASITSAAATVTLTVDAGVPTATPQTTNVAFNTATAIVLAGTDPDLPVLPLTFVVTVDPVHGALSGTAPNLTYTPTAGYNGPDSFQFTATNTASKTSIAAIVALTVAAGMPTADPQSKNVPFQTATAITLTGSDPDVPALTLTYVVTVIPVHGTLSGTQPNLTYTPAAGYSGADSFQFTVTNTANNTSTAATVSITIPIGAPSANAQSVNVPFNTATAVTLTGSDPNTGVTETPLTFAVTVTPTHGTLSGTEPNLTYTPAAGYNGADSFQFTTTNQSGITSVAATVSLTVAAGVPTATAQTTNVAFNTATAIVLAGIDPNVPMLALTFAVTLNPAHGTLSGTAPNLTYTPAAGYNGADSFQFTATNTAGKTSAAATVSLTVAAGTPTANAQSMTVTFNTPQAITLTGSDPNVPALALTFAVTGNPAHGALSGTAPNLTYTPTSGYSGPDSFKFTATNSASLTSAAATVSITVTNVAPEFSSSPSATPNPATVAQSVTFVAAATDSNNDPLTYAWNFGDGSTGSGATAAHTYSTPGTYIVSATVTDSINAAVSASVTVVVNAAVATVGSGPDSDGDGFSDSYETAVGSDPNNIASTATGQVAGTVQPLAISKASVKLNFAKPNDAIAFSGTLSIPAGFKPNGSKVFFDFSGVAKTLTLTSKGSAKVGGDSMKITIKAKKGVVAAQTSAYKVAFTKGNFAATLAGAGFTNATLTKSPVSVLVSLIFNGTVFQATKTLSYTAKQGKSGSAK